MNTDYYSFGQNEGFSLLEVMVVAGLTLAFAWLSVLEIRNVLHDLNLRSDAQKVRALIQEAQSITARYQSESSIRIHGGQIYLMSDSKPTYSTIEPVRTMRPQSATTVLLTPDLIRFFPSHANTPSRILLVRAERSCELTLSLRGRIRERCR